MPSQIATARPRPVLMTPVRRCGSHALRLRLSFNPDFYAPYPLHLVDFMPLVEQYGDLSDDDVYFQLIVDIVGLQTASMVKWDGVVFDPVDLFEKLKNQARGVHSVVWELLFDVATAHQAKVVMDKSLDSVHYADELLELFDDMIFLNVVRDPRAQVASMNRAIIHEFDTLLNTEIWVAAHDAARRLIQKCPERVLTVRFEDFLADQETVLKRICVFLGIEFLPQMLDVSQSDEARKISALSALWESNASRPIPANIDKFKKSLGIEEIEIIETLAGDHMDFYGYERMTPAAAKITAQLRTSAGDKSKELKKQAWEDLRAKNSHDYMLRRFRADYIDMVKTRIMSRGVVRTAAKGGAEGTVDARDKVY